MILSGPTTNRFRVPNLKVVYTLGAHKDTVLCVKWSPSGDKFVYELMCTSVHKVGNRELSSFTMLIKRPSFNLTD